MRGMWHGSNSDYFRWPAWGRILFCVMWSGGWVFAAASQLQDGGVRLGRRGEFLSRADNPMLFWLAVALCLALAVIGVAACVWSFIRKPDPPLTRQPERRALEVRMPLDLS